MRHHGASTTTCTMSPYRTEFCLDTWPGVAIIIISVCMSADEECSFALLPIRRSQNIAIRRQRTPRPDHSYQEWELRLV